MDLEANFEDLSLRGRIAYGIMGAENYVLAIHPERDWKPVFAELWRITGDLMRDDWADRVADLLPEYIHEGDPCDEDEFSWIGEEGFEKLKALYAGMPEGWSTIVRDIFDMEEEYAYTSIPGRGSESISMLEEIMAILRAEGVKLPDPKSVAFSRFAERRGRGDYFDGTPLSRILQSHD